MPLPIENHALIGDGRTTALVAIDGRIGFMCWPRCDSPTIFASMLDETRGGSFDLSPVLADAKHRQMYLPDSNLLLSRFLSAEGVVEVSDFMPTDGPQRLIRRVKAVRNDARIRVRCDPRFDYGRATHETSLDQQGVRFVSSVGLSMRLRATVPLLIRDGVAIADFTLKVGESACFVLEQLDAPPIDDLHQFVAASFKSTLNFWRGWIAKSTYRGRWRDMVNRSALLLKLLTSREHGSMIAAPTFSLPEHIGGERNWDYRYTWMRDAAFTVYGYLRLGFVEEANAFMRWLVARAVESHNHGRLQIVYGVDGHTNLEESTLDHLSGYLDSKPVRIGNAASEQLQLDIYGELMDAVYLSDKYGEQLSWEGWNAISKSIAYVVENWHLPDEGIWEIRGGQHEFLHSRLMCWVALDRAIRLATKRGLPAPREAWATARDAIADDIHENFWDAGQQSFVQRKGSSDLDASCLLMPLVRFIPATDPRWLSTMAAVRTTLMDDSLLFRYSTEHNVDGLRGEEGTFSMCSFWYVECLARSGNVAQARFLFEKMLGYANHVGLYAEEIGPSGEHLGNFPQAFTHIALISAAYYLDRVMGQ